MTDPRVLQRDWDEEALASAAVRRARLAMAGRSLRFGPGSGILLCLLASVTVLLPALLAALAP